MDATFYDRDGNEIDLIRWSRLFDDQAYRTIARTRIGRSDVLTLWVGFDQNWFGTGPRYFETTVYGGALHDVVWRWGSLTEAQAGHEDVVELAGRNPVVRWWQRLMTRYRNPDTTR